MAKQVSLAADCLFFAKKAKNRQSTHGKAGLSRSGLSVFCEKSKKQTVNPWWGGKTGASGLLLRLSVLS